MIKYMSAGIQQCNFSIIVFNNISIFLNIILVFVVVVFLSSVLKSIKLYFFISVLE